MICSEGRVIGNHFYFYPMFISNSGKKKMTGIGRDCCSSFLKALNTYCFFIDQRFELELDHFSALCAELKGISLCIENKNIGYNIYIKCSHKELASFLEKRSSVKIPEGSILTAMRIRNGKISGYNVYYPGEYAKPCCGWGEIIE